MILVHHTIAIQLLCTASDCCNCYLDDASAHRGVVAAAVEVHVGAVHGDGYDRVCRKKRGEWREEGKKEKPHTTMDEWMDGTRIGVVIIGVEILLIHHYFFCIKYYMYILDKAFFFSIHTPGFALG